LSNKEEGAEEAGPIPDRGATEAILRDGKVNVSSQSEADSLAQSGYGVRIEKNKLQLNLPEALYLVAEQRLRVTEGDARLEFQELLRRARRCDSDVWAKYILYRDLRSRGYVVREGSIGGTEFRVYERGEYPDKAAKYEVFTIREGIPLPVSRLSSVLRLSEAAKKRLIIAVVDRHGEVVYYSLAEYSPS